MQSADGLGRCHLGQTLLYDTVANLSWSVGVTHHSINVVVDTILGQPWLPAVEIGREVPVPISEEDCIVRPSLVLPDHPLIVYSRIASTGNTEIFRKAV